ncbi:alpha/beta hydrolase [Parerythrobacter aurantius]|uniref:alpha/beta hydrolase n=1 Tax=Parerythrobacter aurantius TaxID=3127706 RepID=UPI003249E8E5
MRAFLALLAVLSIWPAAPSAAQQYVVTLTISEQWVEEAPESADRTIAFRRARTPTSIAAYGPFRVLDEKRAVLVGITGPATPDQFRAMLRDYPALARLEFLECPGTDDDRANLETGRLIRAAGLETHVPADGSVRSGAVELFLAGQTRSIEDGAEFAVHSWLDESGHEADDYAADSPEHAAYLRYYRDMGMDPAQARAFYEMTNSVPHETALWLTAQDMRRWLAGTAGGVAPAAPAPADPRISYLDLGAASF